MNFIVFTCKKFLFLVIITSKRRDITGMLWKYQYDYITNQITMCIYNYQFAVNCSISSILIAIENNKKTVESMEIDDFRYQIPASFLITWQRFKYMSFIDQILYRFFLYEHKVLQAYWGSDFQKPKHILSIFLSLIFVWTVKTIVLP